MSAFLPVRARAPALLAALLLWSVAAGAVDLGVIGPVHPISEPDLIRDIKATLTRKEQSGELARLQKQAQARAIAQASSPTPTPGVRTATASRSFYWDPTLVVAENIVDARGQLIAAAGTRVNPLDYTGLARPILFIDARDERQLALARRRLQSADGVRLVLTGGSYLELMKQWRVRVYFDQDGDFTAQLGIQQVPALVTQEGRRLRIDEIRMEDVQ